MQPCAVTPTFLRFEECQAKFQGNPHVQVCAVHGRVAAATLLTRIAQQPAVKPSSDKVHDHEVLFVKSVCLL